MRNKKSISRRKKRYRLSFTEIKKHQNKIDRSFNNRKKTSKNTNSLLSSSPQLNMMNKILDPNFSKRKNLYYKAIAFGNSHGKSIKKADMRLRISDKENNKIKIQEKINKNSKDGNEFLLYSKKLAKGKPKKIKRGSKSLDNNFSLRNLINQENKSRGIISRSVNVFSDALQNQKKRVYSSSRIKNSKKPTKIVKRGIKQLINLEKQENRLNLFQKIDIRIENQYRLAKVKGEGQIFQEEELRGEKEADHDLMEMIEAKIGMIKKGNI